MCPKNQYLKIHHLFWQELLLWHLELHKTFDLTHLQVFLAQPVLQMHLTKLCLSPIDCKRDASRTLISVYEFHRRMIRTNHEHTGYPDPSLTEGSVIHGAIAVNNC